MNNDIEAIIRWARRAGSINQKMPRGLAATEKGFAGNVEQ